MNNLMSETAGTPFYTLRVNGHDLIVDGSKKGQPGDVVVVWPVKGGPLVARRLARCRPPTATTSFRRWPSAGRSQCRATKSG